MTLQARHHFQLNIFEKLGGPLLAAVAEATARDDLIARQQGATPVEVSDAEEAERIANLLSSTAELGLALSRQLDLRMVDDAAADGVRLTLAALAAPLIANVYRVAGRSPNTVEIERMVGAIQAVTLFADNFHAGADATARMQNIEQDFGPADGPQVQLMVLNALMPAVNAVCTFSFGQPEKNLLQEVMGRLQSTAKGLVQAMFADASERDALRAEIGLLRTAANLYSQVHFTEMSKLMFMEESQRDRVDLSARLADLWRVVDTRLAMLRVLADVMATGTSGASSGGVSAVPSPVVAPVSGGPLGTFAAKPAASVPANTVTAAPAAPPPAAAGGSPFSAFVKPQGAAGGGA